MESITHVVCDLDKAQALAYMMFGRDNGELAVLLKSNEDNVQSFRSALSRKLLMVWLQIKL